MTYLDMEINIKLVRVNHLWYGNNAFLGNNIAGMALYRRNCLRVCLIVLLLLLFCVFFRRCVHTNLTDTSYRLAHKLYSIFITNGWLIRLG